MPFQTTPTLGFVQVAFPARRLGRTKVQHSRCEPIILNMHGCRFASLQSGMHATAQERKHPPYSASATTAAINRGSGGSCLEAVPADAAAIRLTVDQGAAAGAQKVAQLALLAPALNTASGGMPQLISVHQPASTSMCAATEL